MKIFALALLAGCTAAAEPPTHGPNVAEPLAAAGFTCTDQPDWLACTRPDGVTHPDLDYARVVNVFIAWHARAIAALDRVHAIRTS